MQNRLVFVSLRQGVDHFFKTRKLLLLASLCLETLTKVLDPFQMISQIELKKTFYHCTWFKKVDKMVRKFFDT